MKRFLFLNRYSEPEIIVRLTVIHLRHSTSNGSHGLVRFAAVVLNSAILCSRRMPIMVAI